MLSDTALPIVNGTALLDELLLEQQSLTAVEQFAETCSSAAAEGSSRYRSLMPLAPPGPGQQYAFEVDLDACSGCKSCVAACHSLNGLDAEESWRSVGQLVGGTAAAPHVQHVTTACHHCVEPACLAGCPVDAYEKDPLTGIVRHLDDQCIGCQYCLLKCPYDVPTYLPSKGIVRKCDMCSQRLAVGEAPACVQGCPNEAIRIRVVDTAQTLEDAEAHSFLPAAPQPSYTAPTTVYKSRQPLPRNSLPADYFAVERAESHLPLVFMLVLTQMSVGAFVVDLAMQSYLELYGGNLAAAVRPLHLTAALALGLLGLAASVLHLGRPQYAYKALLGLRTSWLSREILAFGLFAATAAVYVGGSLSGFFTAPGTRSWQTVFGFAAAGSGAVAIGCSAMIYVDTYRPCWTFATVMSKFYLTALVLGIPMGLLLLLVGAARTDQATLETVKSGYLPALCQLLALAASCKLLIDLSVLAHLRSRQHTPQKRSALLLTGELAVALGRRVFLGVVGGLLLPAVLLSEGQLVPHYHPLFIGLASLLMLAVLTLGELQERYLFFAASVAPRMPGAVE